MFAGFLLRFKAGRHFLLNTNRKAHIGVNYCDYILISDLERSIVKVTHKGQYQVHSYFERLISRKGDEFRPYVTIRY